MAISTNSIIHYTKSFTTLSSILQKGLRLKYCLEYLTHGKTTTGAAHPMISFCDVPLSSSSQHFAAYGRYGIGLSKQWAIRHEVNPVIYFDKNSHLSSCLKSLLEDQRNKNSGLTASQGNNILRIKAYAKNYSRDLKRGGKIIKNYRFYDEREWRLVPPREILKGNKFSVAATEYISDKDGFNSKLSDIYVNFNHDDISYIIVKSTSEIPRMTDCVRKYYSAKCTVADLDILLSKICSTEQILEDY